jgi:hypothetical protein
MIRSGRVLPGASQLLADGHTTKAVQASDNGWFISLSTTEALIEMSSDQLVDYRNNGSELARYYRILVRILSEHMRRGLIYVDLYSVSGAVSISRPPVELRRRDGAGRSGSPMVRSTAAHPRN